MLTYWPEFLAFATVHIFSLISPGPDFMMVVRNSTSYSRRSALLTALGISIGEITHITYSILGVGLLLANSSWGLTALKYVGAAYLVYIGIQSLRAKKMSLPNDPILAASLFQDLTPGQAFRAGFLTNALNAKASFFTISCFAVLVSPQTPLSVQCVYGVFIVITTLMWFALVATVLTHDKIQASIFGMKHWVERTAGAILLVLGVKLSLSDMASIVPTQMLQ